MSYERAIGMGTNGAGQADRALAAQWVDYAEQLIRNAQTGSDEERFAGRERLRQWLSHHDTVEEVAGFRSGNWPADVAARALDVFTRAQRVSEGLPEHDYSQYLIWGGVGLGVLVLGGLMITVLR